MGQTILVETTDGTRQIDLESCSEMILAFNGVRHVVTQANIKATLAAYMNADVAYQQVQNSIEAGKRFMENNAAIDEQFRKSLLGR